MDSLTRQQAVNSTPGAITNWKEVGGADAKIIAYQRNETSGQSGDDGNVVMDGQPMMDAPECRPRRWSALSGKYLQQRRRHRLFGVLPRDGDVPAEGVKLRSPPTAWPPRTKTIASGEYPTQYNYAVIRKDEPEDSPARQLFDFLGTAEGRR